MKTGRYIEWKFKSKRAALVAFNFIETLIRAGIFPDVLRWADFEKKTIRLEEK